MIVPSDFYHKKTPKKNLARRIAYKLTEKPILSRSKEAFYFLVYPRIRNFVRKPCFQFYGRSIKYGTLVKNLMLATERAVEVPIVWKELERRGGVPTLEIGNVLSHYSPAVSWDVIDKYEEGPHVINEDIIDFHPHRQYDFIFSISTIEHIGFNEKVKDAGKIGTALSHIINNLLADGGVFMATFPLGWNPDLDESLRQKTLPFDKCMLLRRTDWANNWEQIPLHLARSKYGRFIGADYLVVAYFKKAASVEKQP